MFKSQYEILENISGIPVDVLTWIEDYLNDRTESDAYEYSDNVRVAQVGSMEQESKYDEAVSNGCCGFYDETESCPIDGKEYRIGFNYGH